MDARGSESFLTRAAPATSTAPSCTISLCASSTRFHRALRSIRISKRIARQIADVELTDVTIRERAVDRAIALKQEGIGPDRILMMVSTSASHMKVNSGLDHAGYWAEAERSIRKAHDAGLKVNGTVSTIWGCPIEGPTRLEDAVEFTKRFLDIGAHDIEHADHDGSAPPNRVYEYYCMVLDAIPDPVRHVAHFHVTRGWGLANVLAALQAGIVRSESTLGGTGGQPANFFDGSPVAGTGRYYYQDPDNVGLVCTEDLVVMLDEMGIETGLDVDRILATGRMAERIAGRRLRSETIKSGRIAKAADGAVGNWAHRSKVESADADHPPKRCSALGTFDFRPDPIHCASSGSPFAWW